MMRRLSRSFARPALVQMAGYPTYNIVKRLSRGVSGFAASSFANNGAEWAFGFLLGLSTAALAAAAGAPPREALWVVLEVACQGTRREATQTVGQGLRERAQEVSSTATLSGEARSAATSTISPSRRSLRRRSAVPPGSRCGASRH